MRGVRTHRDELLASDFFVLDPFVVNGVHIAKRSPKQEYADVAFVHS